MDGGMGMGMGMGMQGGVRVCCAYAWGGMDGGEDGIERGERERAQGGKYMGRERRKGPITQLGETQILVLFLTEFTLKGSLLLSLQFP